MLKGLAVHGTDGAAGKLEDAFCEDKWWTIRFVVVDVHPWLPGHHVLLPIADVSEVSRDGNAIEIRRTREEIRAARDITSEAPLPRVRPDNRSRSAPWPIYFRPYPACGGGTPVERQAAESAKEQKHELGPPFDDECVLQQQDTNRDAFLWSLDDLTGYRLCARDGQAGRIVNFWIDEAERRVRYLAVALPKMIGRRHILLPAEWLEGGDWEQRCLRTDVSVRQLADAPSHIGPCPPTREEEQQIFATFDRTPYWERRGA